MRSPVDCGMLGSGESGERKYASKGAFLLDITTRLKPRLSTRARADVVLDRPDNEEEVMGRKEGGRVERLGVLGEWRRRVNVQDSIAFGSYKACQACHSAFNSIYFLHQLFIYLLRSRQPAQRIDRLQSNLRLKKGRSMPRFP